MPYRVRILNSVSAKIASWGLPDDLLVDVHHQLRERLPQGPQENLVRTRAPYDGMVFTFPGTNPDNPDDVYQFVFHVCYESDEETLIVLDGGYLRGIEL